MDDKHELVVKLKELTAELQRTPTLVEFRKFADVTDWKMRKIGGLTELLRLAGLQPKKNTKDKKIPKILILDIETAPMLAQVWGMWDQNIGLDMIKEDWFIMCWSAKWFGQKKIFYEDIRKEKVRSDKTILQGIWDLMDEADIVVTQNGNSFDIKKLFARFILNGMRKPSSFRKLDTKIMAKRSFSFTSNKLAYMTDKLNTKYKKLDHGKFPGFKLWDECLKWNEDAWVEMEKYNKYDILSLEELFLSLIPWDSTINFSVYSEEPVSECFCGNKHLVSHGFKYTNAGQFRRLICEDCGAEFAEKDNLFSKEKRTTLIKR